MGSEPAQPDTAGAREAPHPQPETADPLQAGGNEPLGDLPLDVAATPSGSPLPNGHAPVTAEPDSQLSASNGGRQPEAVEALLGLANGDPGGGAAEPLLCNGKWGLERPKGSAVAREPESDSERPGSEPCQADPTPRDEREGGPEPAGGGLSEAEPDSGEGVKEQKGGDAPVV